MVTGVAKEAHNSPVTHQDDPAKHKNCFFRLNKIHNKPGKQVTKRNTRQHAQYTQIAKATHRPGAVRMMLYGAEGIQAVKYQENKRRAFKYLQDNGKIALTDELLHRKAHSVTHGKKERGEYQAGWGK